MINVGDKQLQKRLQEESLGIAGAGVHRPLLVSTIMCPSHVSFVLVVPDCFCLRVSGRPSSLLTYCRPVCLYVVMCVSYVFCVGFCSLCCPELSACLFFLLFSYVSMW